MRLIAYPPEEESLKREVMTHFGHMCVCPDCGVTELRLLHLDHKHGGGNAERRAKKRRGSSFYREVKDAIDRDTPDDRTWLDTLQILCLDCNLSKLAGEACTLDHLNQENAQESQDDTDDLASDETQELVSRNAAHANDPLERLSTRVPRSVKKFLMVQGDANVGETIAKLVRASQSTEFSVLAEVCAFRREQIERHKELLTMLSDLVLQAAATIPRQLPLSTDDDPAMTPEIRDWLTHASPPRPVVQLPPTRPRWQRFFLWWIGR